MEGSWFSWDITFVFQKVEWSQKKREPSGTCTQHTCTRTHADADTDADARTHARTHVRTHARTRTHCILLPAMQNCRILDIGLSTAHCSIRTGVTKHYDSSL